MSQKQSRAVYPIVILIVLAIITTIFMFRNGPTTTEQEVDMIILGQIQGVKDRDVLTIDLFEDVQGIKAMEEAAIADEVCTEEQVKQQECLNNPFYIRNQEKTIQLRLQPKTKIKVYAREPRGGFLVDDESNIYFQSITPETFTQLYQGENTPEYAQGSVYYFSIIDDRIVGIQEKYLP